MLDFVHARLVPFVVRNGLLYAIFALRLMNKEVSESINYYIGVYKTVTCIYKEEIDHKLTGLYICRYGSWLTFNAGRLKYLYASMIVPMRQDHNTLSLYHRTWNQCIKEESHILDNLIKCTTRRNLNITRVILRLNDYIEGIRGYPVQRRHGRCGGPFLWFTIYNGHLLDCIDTTLSITEPYSSKNRISPLTLLMMIAWKVDWRITIDRTGITLFYTKIYYGDCIKQGECKNQLSISSPIQPRNIQRCVDDGCYLSDLLSGFLRTDM